MSVWVCRQVSLSDLARITIYNHECSPKLDVGSGELGSNTSQYVDGGLERGLAGSVFRKWVYFGVPLEGFGDHVFGELQDAVRGYVERCFGRVS